MRVGGNKIGHLLIFILIFFHFREISQKLYVQNFCWLEEANIQANFDFLKIVPMKTVCDQNEFNFRIFSWNFYTFGPSSKKHIVHNLRWFKDLLRRFSILCSFYPFFKFSWLSSFFFLRKTRNAIIKLSLNRFKLCTMFFCDNWSHVKKILSKTVRLKYLYPVRFAFGFISKNLK